ncbi:hypothetical protein ACNOYE_39520 [Nannocystaceae bacterium ST9]
MIDVAAIALIVLVAAVLVVYRRQLAAIWFRSEDPRTLGLFRIAFGCVLLGNLSELAPLTEYLLSADGLMSGERARASGHQISLLYEHDSLEFVTAYVAILGVACVAFTLGLATAISKWLTWFLYLGMIARIGPAWQGDHLFACFLFYLCLARCGESYAIDAWIRNIRNPQQPRHRPIPAWPRNLMLLHMIPMLCGNGLVKTGELWRDGDMFFLLFNDPRMGPSVWEVSALFGTNLFREATWVAQVWEILFPLVLVGIIADRLRRADLPSPTRVGVWLARGLLFVIGALVVALAFGCWDRIEVGSVLMLAAGMAIGLTPLTLALVRRIPERARRWIFGRRVWASLLVVFGGTLFFVLRIDWFTGVPLVCAILLFEGEELGWGPGSVAPPELARARRAAVAVFSTVHAITVALLVLPRAEPTSAWRKTLEAPARSWVENTVGRQFWRLIANGDRAWVQRDIELIVQDESGERHSVGDGILPVDDSRALDRREQIRERMQPRDRAGHAHWVCRHLADPRGATVIFQKVTRWMPTPEQLVEFGPEAAAARVEKSRLAREFDRRSCVDL